MHQSKSNLPRRSRKLVGLIPNGEFDAPGNFPAEAGLASSRHPGPTKKRKNGAPHELLNFFYYPTLNGLSMDSLNLSDDLQIAILEPRSYISRKVKQ